MKILGVVNIQLRIVRVEHHLLHYTRCNEGRMVDHVLGSLVC